MHTSEATTRGTITRRGACGWLLASLLAACGGSVDAPPAVVTATAAYVNTAVSASVAAVGTSAAASTATATLPTAAATTTTAPPTAPPATPVGAVPAMPPARSTGTPPLGSVTPTPLSAGIVPPSRPAITAAPPAASTAATTPVAGGTPSGTRSSASAAPATTRSATGAANPTATVSGGAVLFTDPGKRFTFSRPGAWRDAPAMAASRDFVTSYLSTMPRGSFNILASTVPPSATLEQYTNANIATIKRDVMGFRAGPVGLQSGDLGGTPAQLYDFFATVAGESQLVTQIYCVRGGTLYVLSFITPTDATPDEERGTTFYDAAQIVVDTWKFL